MTEEWKIFPVIEGRKFSKYEVSSLGQRRNKRSGYIYSDLPNSSGYVRNEFRDDKGKSKNISAHVIVAMTFIGEPESDDLTVDHINRDPTDNRLVNLRWATQKQQVANSDKSSRGPKGQPVIQYTMDMEEIKRWPNIITASKELGINRSSISTVCSTHVVGAKRGKIYQAGGYRWTYERQDLDEEVWKEYKPMSIRVSNMGRIKPPHCHIIYGSKTGEGYLSYGESKKLVHIIIAEAFLPNPEKKPEVNHKDKIRSNNKLENLEWATKSEQMIHSHQNNSNPNRYSTSRAVKQYDLERNFIGEYKSIKEASRKTGCSISCIYNVCSGLSKSHKGYVFKYSDENVLNRPATKCPNNVDRIDEDGNVIKTYKSIRAAAIDLEISYSSIYTVLGRVTKKTRGGYRFRYH